MFNTKHLRMTRQRKLILEALWELSSHPTADEVYEMVRRRMPRVSLGTVYRNLEALSDAGVILRLPGTPMRFDGDTRPHYHIRCLRCGKIDDLPAGGRIVVRRNIKVPAGWDLVGYHVELVGLCPRCKSETAAARPGEITGQEKGKKRWQI